VAVVGSGPAGFYIVQHLLQAPGIAVRVDMFERLPTPYGLVRYGVAPDHPKIKSVESVYDKLAARPEFRFYGNVDYGRDLSLEDLREHYDQIVFCTGAQTDRRLGIPGEDLPGSHAATEFVAWYNGHPDFSDRRFDLGGRSAVVIGVGNVAVDVARILCRTPEELATTDIADYALAALRCSRIEEVHLLGRRGPLQAAFTNPEIKELGELADACTSTIPAEVALDDAERSGLDRATARKVEILQSYAGRTDATKSRRLAVRFLVSPTEILGDEKTGVRAVRVARNELCTDEKGRVTARATDVTELLEAGLVFRSVGYRGVPLSGLPFHEAWGVVPNAAGRVVLPETGGTAPGIYVAGWIKRGPSGVIGTNKPDAGETVGCMLEDHGEGRTLTPSRPGLRSIEERLAARNVRFVTYGDWKALDLAERERGKPAGRPRVKFTAYHEFLGALERRVETRTES
jgi:ferredoxin--NADP+ reductase